MKEKRDFCAGIVTFNPEIERLKSNINSIISQVSFLIICDNGSDNIDLITEAIRDFDHIILIKSNENRGIAFALNKIFEYAIQEIAANWVLTLDQDSVCPPNIIDVYANYCNDSIGIICPVFRDPSVSYGTEAFETKVRSINHCITSGSLTNVNAWKSVSGFDDFMFIDFVDFDFCHRIKQNRFQILQTGDVVLNHTIGKSQVKRFLGKQFVITNHSNMRKYYMMRNYIYYRHKNGITDAAQKKAMISKVIKTIAFEKGKCGSISSFWRGWLDGKRIINGRNPKGWIKS